MTKPLPARTTSTLKQMKATALGNSTVLALINVASAAFAVFAAMAWITSANVTVIYDGKGAVRPPGSSLPKPALLYDVDKNGQQIDLIPTLKKQSLWNSTAAWLAAAAALLQAFGTFYGMFYPS